MQPGWLARAARGQAGRPTQQGGSGMVRFTDSPAGWASPVLSENSSVGCLVLHFLEWPVLGEKQFRRNYRAWVTAKSIKKYSLTCSENALFGE